MSRPPPSWPGLTRPSRIVWWAIARVPYAQGVAAWMAVSSPRHARVDPRSRAYRRTVDATPAPTMSQRQSNIVLVNDRMQSGYRYALTRAGGARLRPRIPARADAERDAGARRLRRQIHDRLPRRIPRRLVRGGEAVAGAARSVAQPFRRRRQPAAVGLARATAGSIPTIRAAGSNGIAATSWAAACRRRTRGRSSAGRRSAAMSRKFAAIASPAIRSAGRASARRCCIGPTTAASSDAQNCRAPRWRSHGRAFRRSRAWAERAETNCGFSNGFAGAMNWSIVRSTARRPSP